MDSSIARELFSSPNGTAVFLLAAPWLALILYVVYLAKTKNGNGNGSDGLYKLGNDLQRALIEQANASISALRKTDVYHSRELVALRERVAKLEAIAGVHYHDHNHEESK